MFRSKTEAKKGKARFPRTVPIKHTDLTICVLPAPTTVTPKATAELELSQAGLGKKVVSVPEDCKHEDVCDYNIAIYSVVLCKTYLLC